MSVSPAGLAKAPFGSAVRGFRAGFALYKFVKVALTVSISFGIERVSLSVLAPGRDHRWWQMREWA